MGSSSGRGTTKSSGLESLRSFLRENRDAFADLSDLDDDARSALGYINRHNGHLEFLIENDRFENAVGGNRKRIFSRLPWPSVNCFKRNGAITVRSGTWSVGQ